MLNELKYKWNSINVILFNIIIFKNTFKVKFEDQL